jgi:hypothetical protein
VNRACNASAIRKIDRSFSALKALLILAAIGATFLYPTVSPDKYQAQLPFGHRNRDSRRQDRRRRPIRGCIVFGRARALAVPRPDTGADQEVEPRSLFRWSRLYHCRRSRLIRVRAADLPHSICNIFAGGAERSGLSLDRAALAPRIVRDVAAGQRSRNGNSAEKAAW